MVDETRDLESEGNVVNEVIPPVVTGRDVLQQEEAKNAAKGNPLGSLAKIIGAVSGLAEGIAGAAEPASRDQALLQGMSSVTRDANGDIQVQPTGSWMFGSGGRVGSAALAQGITSELRLKASEDINKLRIDAGGDLEEFDKSRDNWLPKYQQTVQNVPGGPEALLYAQQEFARHRENMVNANASAGIKNAQQSLLLGIDKSQTDLEQLARQGAMDTPDFEKIHGQMVKDYGQLGSDPLSGWSQARVEQSLHQSTLGIAGANLTGNIDEAWRNGGALAATDRAQDAIQDQEGLTEAEKDQLTQQARNRLTFLQGDNRADVAALRNNINNLDKMLQAHESIAPSMFDELGKRADELGDAEGHMLIDSLRTVRPFSQNGLSPAQTAGQLAAPPALAPAQLGISPQGGEFDIDRYKAGVKAIESHGNPNAVSPTGYKGLYQFGPAEWAQYGAKYGTITNPIAQEKAMVDYTNDHYRQLTVSLGRAPTPGELYLAHQQGVAGATQLIQNPSTPAGDLVPAANIRANGGDPNAPASQFVQKWETRFATASGGAIPATAEAAAIQAPPSANGIPFTPQQVAANPYLLHAHVLQMAIDKDARDQLGERMLNSAIKSTGNGIPISAPALAQIDQLTAGNPKLEEKRDTLLGSAIVQNAIAGQGPPAAGGGGQTGAAGWAGGAAPQQAGQPTTMEELRSQAQELAASTDIRHQRIGEQMQKQIVGSAAALKEDPFGYALKQKTWIPPQQLQPLDFNNPGQLAAGLAQRGAIAENIHARQPDFAPSAVLPQDLSGVKNIISSGSPDQKVALLGAIGRLPDSQQQATLDALKITGKDGATFGQAARVAARGDRSVAQDILTGMSVLQLPDANQFKPKEEQSGPEYATMLPSTDLPSIEARGRIYDASEAVYAARMYHAGRAGDQFDADMWKTAVNDVTGGVLDFRGTKIIAPVPHMTQDQLPQRLSELTDADMHGGTLGGHLVSASQLTAPWNSWFGTRNPIRLITRDPDAGTYLVISGDPTAPQKVIDPTTGRPLVLNLSGRPQ